MSFLPLSVWKNPHRLIMRRNIVTPLALSILNGSSSFLHIIRTTIKAWMSLNFRKIPSLASELAALECQKN